jgi:hypothetical protein
LQSCNQWHSHMIAKRQTETMVGNQFSCLAFLLDFVGWTGTKIDYLPFSELKNVCSSATTSMIKIIGTYENSIKFSNGVVCHLSRAYVINAGHDAK